MRAFLWGESPTGWGRLGVFTAGGVCGKMRGASAVRWGMARIYFPLSKTYSKGRERKEIAMNGSEFFILYFAVRIIIPFGMLMLFGEMLRRHDANYWLK